jgi:DNA-binding transcriptional LysR family regulator
VDNVFSSLEEGVNELRKAQGHSENQVLIGIQTPYVWQDLTRDFLSAYPNVTLGQRSIESSDYIDQLLREEIDFHIGTLGDGDHGRKEALLEAVEFARGAVYAIVHPKNPLAGKESVRMQNLRDEYIIARNRSDNFQQYTDRLCREAGFEPRIALECDYTLREQMVEQGYGISFSTEYALRWLDNDNVVPVRIEGPGICRQYQLIWKKDRAFSPIMQKFYDFTVSYLT